MRCRTLGHSLALCILAALATAGAAAPTSLPAPNLPPATLDLLVHMRIAYASLGPVRWQGKIAATYDVAGRTRTREARFTDRFVDVDHYLHELPDGLTVYASTDGVITFVPSAMRFYRFERPEGAASLSDFAKPAADALAEHDLSLLLAAAPDAHAALKALGELFPGEGADELVLRRADKSVHRLRFDPKTHLLSQVMVDERAVLDAAGVPSVVRAERTTTYEPPMPMPLAEAKAVTWSPPALAQQVEPGSLAGVGDLTGKPAPALSLPDLAGERVTLESLRGRVVVIDFWASWCGPCRVGLPHLIALSKQRAGDGVTVLAVNLREANETVAQFVAAEGLAADNLRVLLDADGKVGQAWGVEVIPFTVVVGADGTVQDAIIGVAPDRVAKAVAAALNVVAAKE